MPFTVFQCLFIIICLFIIYCLFKDSFPCQVITEVSPDVLSVGARSLLQYRGEGSPAPYAPVEFRERGSTCILLWAKNLTVSEYRSGKWERHNLSPKTFGEGVSPKLEGSSCNATHSRWAAKQEVKFGPSTAVAANRYTHLYSAVW